MWVTLSFWFTQEYLKAILVSLHALKASPFQNSRLWLVFKEKRENEKVSKMSTLDTSPITALQLFSRSECSVKRKLGWTKMLISEQMYTAVIPFCCPNSPNVASTINVNTVNIGFFMLSISCLDAFQDVRGAALFHPFIKSFKRSVLFI